MFFHFFKYVLTKLNEKFGEKNPTLETFFIVATWIKEFVNKNIIPKLLREIDEEKQFNEKIRACQKELDMQIDG